MFFHSRVLLGVLFAFALSNSAFACSCTFYPHAGTYGSGDEEFKLEYVGQTKDVLPSALILTAKREGDGSFDALVTLSCEGDRWVGVERTFVGEFIWMIDGVRSRFNFDIPADFSSLFASAIEFSSDVKLTIIIPPMRMVPNTQTRHGEPVAQSGAKSPAFICGQIQQQIDGNDEWIKAYKDPNIMEYSENNNVRAYDHSKNYYLDGNDVLREFAAGNANGYTHEDLVDAQWAGRLEWSDKIPSIRPASGGSGVGESASMAQSDCSISLPEQPSGAGSCHLRPILKGTLVHEQSHETMCKKKNNLDQITKPSGGLVNNYEVFSELPANSADDEISAYEDDNRYLNSKLVDYGCPRRDGS